MGKAVDALMRLALGLKPRRGKPRGVLLVSARGPAEMVFLAAVLPRFMALAEPGEDVTLLLRPDSAGMSFLFPRPLKLKRVAFARLGLQSTRWAVFKQLYQANYRLVISLDHRRTGEDDAVLAATGAAKLAVMGAAPAGRSGDTVVFDAPLRQDKILRWSHFCDALGGLRHPPALALMPDHRLPDPMRFELPTAIIFPFSTILGRQLLPEMWEMILNALPADWHVRIAGHQRDFDRNPQYMALLNRPRVTMDTSGFDMLASELLGARMVIGADTAGIHLSILLGAPTLVLASAAWVGAGVPYADGIAPANAHFLYQPMECQGCMDKCPFDPIQGMLPCVAQINPERVLGEIADMIARGGF